MQFYAVVTGDIVNSTKLDKQETKKLMQQLNELFKPYRYEFYRGDSFQLFAQNPNDALGIILKARTAAISIRKIGNLRSDIKCCIAIGEVDTPVRSIKTATGNAFIMSGRQFDAMEKDQKLCIVCNENEFLANKAFRIMSYFIDYLFTNLTSKQAYVVFEALKGHTQTEIAELLQKSQATINKHIQAAGWKEIERVIKEYKIIVEQIMKTNG